MGVINIGFSLSYMGSWRNLDALLSDAAPTISPQGGGSQKACTIKIGNIVQIGNIKVLVKDPYYEDRKHLKTFLTQTRFTVPLTLDPLVGGQEDKTKCRPMKMKS